MKQMIKQMCNTPKDLIAMVIIGSYCLCFIASTLIPHPAIMIDDLLGRQFERIMLMVVGFYFGSHTLPPRPASARSD